MKKTLTAPTLRASALALMIVGLTACSSTKLENAWTAPEATNLHFTKILVFAATPDLKVRKEAEEAMKARITGVTTVTSSELMPNAADMQDNAKVEAAIKATGIDGIVTVRMSSSVQEQNYNDNGDNSTFKFYSMRGPLASNDAASAAAGYGTGYDSNARHDTVIGVDTKIYDAKTDKLVWSATTKTTNPRNAVELVDDVAKEVRKELVAKKLIPDVK